VSDTAFITHERRDDTLVVRVEGPANGYRSSWQEAIDAQILKAGGDVVMVMIKATLIDSRGVGYVLGLHKGLNAQGRRLLIVLGAGVVGEVFEATGILPLLRCFESEAAALKG
jgi:anti-anti-sigma factor